MGRYENKAKKLGYSNRNEKLFDDDKSYDSDAESSPDVFRSKLGLKLI